MDKLKTAIQSNNKKKVEGIFEQCRRQLPRNVYNFSAQQLNALEKDELGTSLIPFDLPICENEAIAVKTLGHGNCLFNSVSFVLCGSYALSNVLRMLTAAEVYIHANQYANHPKLQRAVDCPEITYSSNNLFSIMLRDEASIISEPVKAIEKEALVTCRDKQWSGMVDIMGIASVLHTNIWSVYPDCNSNIRPFISGIVEPLIPSNDSENIFIMWSRDGNMDITHGRPFEPNHFIPILYKYTCPEEMEHGMVHERPTKTRKTIDEGKISKLNRKIVDAISKSF